MVSSGSLDFQLARSHWRIVSAVIFDGETGCLILDVQMPKMSGVDLQDHLSQNGFDIPIIFITAYSDEATKERALNAGAICFLRKPLDIGRRLIDCLHAALDRGRGPAPAT
jgi:FixJ family two-component response regulator